jgi:uncharacterized membrane protein YfhO
MAESDAAPGRAEVLEYSPDRVVVRVEAEQPGYLVLTDRWEEGWRARIDGSEAPVLRADAVFRAVPVQPGISTVSFTYQPPGVLLGTAVSLATAGLLVAAGLWLLAGARRARAADAHHLKLERQH